MLQFNWTLRTMLLGFFCLVLFLLHCLVLRKECLFLFNLWKCSSLTFILIRSLHFLYFVSQQRWHWQELLSPTTRKKWFLSQLMLMRGTVDQWAYSLLISFRFQGAQDRNLRKPLFLLEHKIKPQKKINWFNCDSQWTDGIGRKEEVFANPDRSLYQLCLVMCGWY